MFEKLSLNQKYLSVRIDFYSNFVLFRMKHEIFAQFLKIQSMLNILNSLSENKL